LGFHLRAGFRAVEGPMVETPIPTGLHFSDPTALSIDGNLLTELFGHPALPSFAVVGEAGIEHPDRLVDSAVMLFAVGIRDDDRAALLPQALTKEHAVAVLSHPLRHP